MERKEKNRKNNNATYMYGREVKKNRLWFYLKLKILIWFIYVRIVVIVLRFTLLCMFLVDFHKFCGISYGWCLWLWLWLWLCSCLCLCMCISKLHHSWDFEKRIICYGLCGWKPINWICVMNVLRHTHATTLCVCMRLLNTDEKLLSFKLTW